MRCFAAVDIDEPIKKMIQKIQAGLKDYDVKLVEPDNLHFTLKFLGEIDKDKARTCESRIERIAGSFKPFEISLLGVGVFPGFNYIKVVWVGVEKGELYNLQKSVEESFSGVFKKDEPFPHLTIARVRSPKNKKDIIDFVNKNKHLWLGKMTVKEIKLKKSTLTPKGPIYRDLRVFKLG